MLTQKEILEKISCQVNLPAGTIKEVINSFIEVIEDELGSNKDCRYHGLGTFKAVTTKKRIGRNPYSGDAMKIPTKVRVRFRPGYRLRMAADGASELLKLHEIAKLMVSELLLYNSADIDEGIKSDNLEKKLESKLKDARENFLSRIPDGVDADLSIFNSAWNRFILKRKKALETMK